MFRSNLRVPYRLDLLLILAVASLSGSQANAAGCQTPHGFAGAGAAGAEDRPYSVLADVYSGRWQYIGGEAVFEFQPETPPCSGPFCQLKSEPERSLDPSLPRGERIVLVAAHCRRAKWTKDNSEAFLGMPCLGTAAEFVDRLLRPPCPRYV